MLFLFSSLSLSLFLLLFVVCIIDLASGRQDAKRRRSANTDCSVFSWRRRRPTLRASCDATVCVVNACFTHEPLSNRMTNVHVVSHQLEKRPTDQDTAAGRRSYIMIRFPLLLLVVRRRNHCAIWQHSILMDVTLGPIYLKCSRLYALSHTLTYTSGRHTKRLEIML